MDEYHEILVKQGFGTLDTVTDITWEDLEEIGIKKLGMNCFFPAEPCLPNWSPIGRIKLANA